MRGRQWALAIGGAVLTAIFTAWMVRQWPARIIRCSAALFAILTAWMTYRIISQDLRRFRCRQARFEGGVLSITTHEGQKNIAMDEVLFIQWRTDLEAAACLWFFDLEKKVLSHLNRDFLPNQDEARAFVTWLQGRSPRPIQVRWTQGHGAKKPLPSDSKIPRAPGK
jgi:hypothetical protein